MAGSASYDHIETNLKTVLDQFKTLIAGEQETAQGILENYRTAQENQIDSAIVEEKIK